MKWTKELPTKVGYYWIRWSDVQTTIIEVVEHKNIMGRYIDDMVFQKLANMHKVFKNLEWSNCSIKLPIEQLNKVDR